MRTLPLFAVLAVAACGQAPESSEPLTPSVSLAPDVEMMAGHATDEHVEVSEGVFLLPTAIDRGLEWHETEPFTGPVNEHQAIFGGGGYCYEYDSDVYYDTTQNGTTFNSDPSWYGYAIAGSYDNGAWGGSDYVSVYAYMSAPTTVDHISTYGYVYINGTYMGYLQSSTYGGFASTSGYFSGSCAGGGTAEVDVRFSHYAYSYGNSWMDFESISLSKSLHAEVQCCP